MDVQKNTPRLCSIFITLFCIGWLVSCRKIWRKWSVCLRSRACLNTACVLFASSHCCVNAQCTIQQPSEAPKHTGARFRFIFVTLPKEKWNPFVVLHSKAHETEFYLCNFLCVGPQVYFGRRNSKTLFFRVLSRHGRVRRAVGLIPLQSSQTRRLVSSSTRKDLCLVPFWGLKRCFSATKIESIASVTCHRKLSELNWNSLNWFLNRQLESPVTISPLFTLFREKKKKGFFFCFLTTTRGPIELLPLVVLNHLRSISPVNECFFRCD